MLFNAITGRLSVYNVSLLAELQKRQLLNAAASNASNSESPIEWTGFPIASRDTMPPARDQGAAPAAASTLHDDVERSSRENRSAGRCLPLMSRIISRK